MKRFRCSEGSDVGGSLNRFLEIWKCLETWQGLRVAICRWPRDRWSKDSSALFFASCLCAPAQLNFLSVITELPFKLLGSEAFFVVFSTPIVRLVVKGKWPTQGRTSGNMLVSWGQPCWHESERCPTCVVLGLYLRVMSRWTSYLTQ